MTEIKPSASVLLVLVISMACLMLGLTGLFAATKTSLSSHISLEDAAHYYNKPLGNSAAVVGHAAEGTGVLYQATYIAAQSDDQNNTATWTGNLHALFIDGSGRLREDGNQDGALQQDDYTIDPIVKVFFDAKSQVSKLARFKFKTSPDSSPSSATEIKPISDLRALWNAGERLSELSDVITQRAYSEKADTGRHIFTFLDLDGDGLVDEREVQDFVPESFDQGRHGILNVSDANSADVLVRYIRGDESENSNLGLRNRTIDKANNDNTEVLRLGDIINSTPTEVGAPAEAYDLLYNDKGYARFRAHYSQRRSVVYAGANDGMIHAFNAGFYNPKTKSYERQGAKSETDHPLGAELWAYIPYNLLPHLYWLTSPQYEHVWYVDGKPRVFDARVFENDATHPGGWGTLMIVGMRLGGGAIHLDTRKHADAFSGFTASGAAITSLTLRSAYVLMDITDPEQKPTVIAEITDPTGQLGYTTGYPSVVPFSTINRDNATIDEQWYLLFGSGPTLSSKGEPLSATANQSAQLYLYDLINKKFINDGHSTPLYDLGNDASTGAANSFVGDPVIADWNMNFKADTAYFGTISGNERTPDGKLFKLDFHAGSGNPIESSKPAHWAKPIMLADAENPIATTPSLSKDEYGQHWVMAGTGRYFTANDARSQKSQSLFAVIDTPPSETVNYGKLVDVSKATITSDGGVQNINGASTHNELQSLVKKQQGWKRTLHSEKGRPAERLTHPMSLLGGTLFAIGFTPCAEACSSQGSSKLYCLNYTTGTADALIPACATETSSTVSKKSTVIIDSVDLGLGQSAGPALHLNSTEEIGRNHLNVITHSSTSAIQQTGTKTGPNARSGEIDWRELKP